MTKQKCNFHTHTVFCDGKSTAEEMVLAAIEKGFTALGFSGHSIYPSTRESSWHMPQDKMPEYIKTIRELKEKYSGQIKIYTGFEADYFAPKGFEGEPPLCIPSKKVYEKFNPDFLVGSVHYLSNPSGFFTVDNVTEKVKNNLLKYYSLPAGENPCIPGGLPVDGKKAVRDYFEAERQMLKSGDFEIWGHPDLIRKRNRDLKFFKENEDWYIKELQETAKVASKTGCIAEINSGAIARGAMDDFYPSRVFLDILYSYKIPICVNSDAHETQFLDCAFDRAYIQAKKTGYTELVYPGNNIVEL